MNKYEKKREENSMRLMIDKRTRDSFTRRCKEDDIPKTSVVLHLVKVFKLLRDKDRKFPTDSIKEGKKKGEVKGCGQQSEG